MTDDERKYVRYLLNRIKDLFGYNEAIKALLITSDLPHRQQLVADLQKHAEELLARPDMQAELDAKFAPHFEEIERGLDQIEAFEALLKAPIKGMPN